MGKVSLQTHFELRRCESRNNKGHCCRLSRVRRHARSLPQAKEEAINDRKTSKHFADLERTSSEASRKGCSELSQSVCRYAMHELRLEDTSNISFDTFSTVQ